jgi:hypothetical protein
MYLLCSFLASGQRLQINRTGTRMLYKIKPPVKLLDNGSSLRISDASGRVLAYIYFRDESAIAYQYLKHDEALDLAKAIARLLRDTPDAS